MEQRIAASGQLRWKNRHRLGQEGSWSSILSKCEKWTAEVSCFPWLHLGRTWKQLAEAPTEDTKHGSVWCPDTLMRVRLHWLHLLHPWRPQAIWLIIILKNTKALNNQTHHVCFLSKLPLHAMKPFLQTWPAQGAHKWKHVVNVQGYHSAVQTFSDHSRILWQLGFGWGAWMTQSLPMSFLVPLIFLRLKEWNIWFLLFEKSLSSWVLEYLFQTFVRWLVSSFANFLIIWCVSWIL